MFKRGQGFGRVIRRLLMPRWLAVGRRRRPLSTVFGLDRGQPIDRWYIERFLETNQQAVRGRVLEIGDSTYTRRFGGDRVLHSDVLHAVTGNPDATLVADLATGSGLTDGAYDCVILTQVLPFIYDVRAAVGTVHRILKPGGVALVTVPGISQVSRYDMERWGDFWRFTDRSLGRLLTDAFPGGTATIESWGNPLVGAAFLYGLSAEDLSRRELTERHEDYPVVLTAVARKAATT
jgi:SAM-dependent methyltransferase